MVRTRNTILFVSSDDVLPKRLRDHSEHHAAIQAKQAKPAGQVQISNANEQEQDPIPWHPVDVPAQRRADLFRRAELYCV